MLVIAYRPTANRQNLLTPQVGENPMFSSFQEHYLGFLSPTDSEALVREIGLWKNIVWDAEAAQKVFQYCGGHPLITRYFASHTCQKGALKHVTEARVVEAAHELQKTLRKNEIGNYYREGVWELLQDEERQVLAWMLQPNAILRPPGCLKTCCGYTSGLSLPLRAEVDLCRHP